MLIRFAVENYLSFKDRQELNMIADVDREMEETHCIKPESHANLRLLKSAAIFGANASGKSNLIKALSFMRDFILHSTAGEKIKDETGFQPFKLDRKKVNEPGLFEVEIVQDEKIYIYGFRLDKEKVVGEWLYSYPQNKRVRLFQREMVEEDHLKLSGSTSAEVQYDYQFGHYFKGEKHKIASLTRENALYLTVGAQFAHPILSRVHRWFAECLKPEIFPRTGGLINFTSEFLYEDDKIKKRVVAFLKSADLGIEDIKIEKLRKEQISGFEKLPEPLRKEIERDIEEGNLIDIEMIHGARSEGDEITANIDFESESMGTQRMYQLAGPLFHILNNGGILLIDEIEDSLHFHLLKMLLSEFFKNSVNAQIICTTHYVQLLDEKLFRRDEIWLTEKQEDGGTDLFSLADFKPRPRKDKSLKNGYLNGAYGALPVLGELLGE